VKLRAVQVSRLENALNRIVGAGNTTKKLSQILAYAAIKSVISYQQIKEIIRDDPEDVLLFADEWRMLVPCRTSKSSSWEDRLLLLKDGERYEIPNVIRYLVTYALSTGTWDYKMGLIELFQELGDPAWEQIPSLIKRIASRATDYRVTGTQIKTICVQFGLSQRVDGLIAELKAIGFLSPKLGSITEPAKVGSPIYEINPSVVI
jgi:hypothetical protein